MDCNKVLHKNAWHWKDDAFQEFTINQTRNCTGAHVINRFKGFNHATKGLWMFCYSDRYTLEPVLATLPIVPTQPWNLGLAIGRHILVENEALKPISVLVRYRFCLHAANLRNHQYQFLLVQRRRPTCSPPCTHCIRSSYYRLFGGWKHSNPSTSVIDCIKNSLWAIGNSSLRITNSSSDSTIRGAAQNTYSCYSMWSLNLLDGSLGSWKDCWCQDWCSSLCHEPVVRESCSRRKLLVTDSTWPPTKRHSFYAEAKTLACEGRTVPALIALLSDSKAEVRAAAAGALMSITISVEAKKLVVADGAVPILAGLLQDRNEHVLLNVIKVV